MSFQELTAAAQTYFPTLKIAYKDQSSFIKLIGALLFFNPGFMTDYITTIGDTVYFPSEKSVTSDPIDASLVLLHECVHMSDEKKWTKLLFAFTYLLPQILILLCPILFFYMHWYIALPITLLFALPLPAYFRMHWEKRAYIAAIYARQAVTKKLNLDPELAADAADDLKQFSGAGYYFMWPFHNIDAEFNAAVAAVNAGNKPYDDPELFAMIDDLVTKI